MPGAAMLTVVAYDIADNRRRRKAAKILEDEMVRVQESVFEARLTRTATTKLLARLNKILGNEDSLRVYAIPKDGLERCHQQGGAPMLDDRDYWLM